MFNWIRNYHHFYIINIASYIAHLIMKYIIKNNDKTVLYSINLLLLNLLWKLLQKIYSRQSMTPVLTNGIKFLFTILIDFYSINFPNLLRTDTKSWVRNIEFHHGWSFPSSITRKDWNTKSENCSCDGFTIFFYYLIQPENAKIGTGIGWH